MLRILRNGGRVGKVVRRRQWKYWRYGRRCLSRALDPRWRHIIRPSRKDWPMIKPTFTAKTLQIASVFGIAPSSAEIEPFQWSGISAKKKIIINFFVVVDVVVVQVRLKCWSWCTAVAWLEALEIIIIFFWFLVSPWLSTFRQTMGATLRVH